MPYTSTMTRNAKPRSGIALGGIGTGSFELRQDGLCYNWQIFNNRPLNLGAPLPMRASTLLFFTVRYQEEGQEPRIKALQIEDDYDVAGIVDHPHIYVFPWLDGVDRIDYTASFPFTRLTFSDAAMPFVVTLEAFSPFIPHNVKNSALPAAVFKFTVTAQTARPVAVMLMASARNAVGYDVPERLYANRAIAGPGYRGCEMTCTGVDPHHSSYGTLGLAAMSEDATHYLGWEHRHPYYEIVLRNSTLPNVDDTAGRNAPDRETGQVRAMERCFSTVARSASLYGVGDVLENTFVLTWHFPNRYAEAFSEQWWRPAQPAPRNEGHYYANFFANAAEVADYVCAHLPDLERRTRAFHTAFYDSSVPAVVLDQVNSHLNTFIAGSWLTRAGDFGIIEGVDAQQTYAGLGTIDVAMYASVMTAALFPELDRNTMRVHARFQQPNGVITHSIQRNFDPAAYGPPDPKRVDMPIQFAYLALRAFFWSGDRDYLREIWPAVQRALEYILRERDKNGDGLPDMEGVMCSYDNFPMYGVSPYIGGQWLAALAAASRAADLLGDNAAAVRYADVLRAGQAVLETQTWNGRYYRLYHHGDQTDEGCMTDQLLGQWAARLAGLDAILDPDHIRQALQYLMGANYHPLYGLRNCTWPGDGFWHEVDKDIWVDQANTAWSGTELAAAALLIYEGQYEAGLRVVETVDQRYRHVGLYWDHKEFGGHYYRPMAAWSLIHALLGLEIADGHYTFAPRVPGNPVRLFFTFAEGMATYTREAAAGETITLIIHNGVFRPCAFTLEVTTAEVAAVQVQVDDVTFAPADFTWMQTGLRLRLHFTQAPSIGRQCRIVLNAR